MAVKWSWALPSDCNGANNAAGVSTPMPIYHFGTRDGLLREVLRHARQRQRDVFGELLRPRPEEPYLATLSRA